MITGNTVEYAAILARCIHVMENHKDITENVTHYEMPLIKVDVCGPFRIESNTITGQALPIV